MENTNLDSKEKENKKEVNTLSIQIPKFSLPGIQSIFLILLIGVGLLQTAQMFGLQLSTASASIKSAPASSSSAPAAAPAGGSTSLPTMVGGC